MRCPHRVWRLVSAGAGASAMGIVTWRQQMLHCARHGARMTSPAKQRTPLLLPFLQVVLSRQQAL